ncbi:2,5-diketo-D-gluconate reductase A [Motilibacter peucedani]|uniref:2,5-diketo-D-gluconate reductase A n=1 Tax=Motilibacter peucedani TaxID=598650 RepID=A0A420XSQ5_9ACTN|nr:aldo/keto reductase [Motilibacter peucedani]RKS77860.1 2,5-diketo-D-gluconate reductase A [Motilibacter peucedani]
MTEPTTVQLRNGAAMPRLGLGTWPLKGAGAERAVATALQLGYRSIDTAEAYGNEDGVGAGLRASGVAREDVFVTTKFDKHFHGVDLVREAFEQSAERLGVDYVDLMLIHWPNPSHDKYVEAFEGLLGLLRDGLVRAVGTSNFKPAHLERLREATGEAPDVNQIQLSPLLTRDPSRAYHSAHGIVTESWSPLGGSGTEVLHEQLVRSLAEKYGRTPAQVVLRWHLELGLVTVPKSGNEQRMRENLEVLGFSLEPDDVAALSALDKGEGAAVDSDAFGH